MQRYVVAPPANWARSLVLLARSLPRSSWARALALTGLAVLLLVQTLSLGSRPTVKEAAAEFEPMAAEEEPQQLHRSCATGLEPQTSGAQTGLLLTAEPPP